MFPSQPGICSPGRFSPGGILGAVAPLYPLLPASPDRTFCVPQNGAIWEGYKTPAAVLNFSFDWSGEICGDLIVSSSWGLESADLAALAFAVDSTGTITTILLSNGVAGNIYRVTNAVVTQSGLIEVATFILNVEQYNN